MRLLQLSALLLACALVASVVSVASAMAPSVPKPTKPNKGAARFEGNPLTLGWSLTSSERVSRVQISRHRGRASDGSFSRPARTRPLSPAARRYRLKGLGPHRYYWHVSKEGAGGEVWGPSSTFIVLDRIDGDEANEYTRDMVANEGAPAFDVTRLSCSVKSKLSARCKFSAFAGDSSLRGSGRLFYKRKTPDNFRYYHYAFTVRQIDEYCIHVLDKPPSQCTDTVHWSG